MINVDTRIPVRDDRIEIPSIDRAAMFLDVLRSMEIELEGSSVIDLGAGYGSISMAIAQSGANVTAMDAAGDRVDELNRRALEEQLTLDAFQANLLEPPRQRDAFDLALLVGVTEYAGLWTDSEPVEDLQVKVLRHAYESLKPGGTLVFCTKNRLWPVFALRDVHTGKPLINVLPRRVAERVSKAILGEPYRRYIHSPSKWSELLIRAGFPNPDVFTPYFSYQYPTHVVRQPRFSDIRELLPDTSFSQAEMSTTRGRAWRVKAAYISAAHAVGFRSSQSVIIRATKP